jgi:hypothetical protein
MKRLLLIFLCLCAQLKAADWYVDDDATGAANGTSWANAWTDTTGIVWSAINSGDTLWFRPGNYGRLVVNNEDGLTIKIDPAATAPAYFSGTDNSIFFETDDFVIDGLVGNQKYLRFTGQNAPAASVISIITVKSCRRITMRGLHLDRQAYFADELAAVNGFVIGNSSIPVNEDVTIEDCYISYMTGDGININKAGPSAGWDKYMIRRCTIFNTGDDGVQHSGNCTLLNNFIDQNGQASLFGGHPDGVQVGQGASYVRIEGNFFTSYTQNIFVERARSYVRIANNVMKGVRVGSTERGMIVSVMDPEDPFRGLVYTPFEGEFLLANNTFYQFRSYNAIHGGGSIDRLVPPEQRFWRNNIFVNCKYMVGSGDMGLLDSSNIYWDTPDVQYYTTKGAPSSTPADNLRKAGLSIKDDPRLTDPANNDYTLKAGSAAIGIGVNLSAYFSTDKTSATRPATGAWDAGAYIYDSGTAPSDTTPPTFVSAAFSSTGTTVTMVFSEAVQGIDLSHYTISGHTLSSLTGSGTTWTFTVSPIRQAGPGTSMTYVGGTGRTRDVSGNLLASGTFSVANGSLATPPQPGRRGGAKRLLRR